MTERLRNESGYSLVEVLAAIIILTVAIIPMVTMFDTGLRSATTSGNYDKARALANQKLEEAKSLPYETLKTNFPSGTGAPDSDGEITSSAISAVGAGLPTGSTYTVEKRYIKEIPTNSGASANFDPSNSATDTKMIRVAAMVNWGDGNTYSASGVVVK